MTGFRSGFKSPTGRAAARAAVGPDAVPEGSPEPDRTPEGRRATEDRSRRAALPYRADIDGLRAIAVAAVIAFHYGPGPVTGGFVGVDVFFVISGYLIADILRRGEGTPSFLAGFGERRVRRILPALLVVLAASGLASAVLMLPIDLKSVGLGLVNAATFNANHYFASLADDYFAAGALAANPVLHTWSLAVEGQFYLAFALFWTAGRGWPNGRAAGLGILAAVSLAASVLSLARWPEAAFYLLPQRFWEFVTGAALVPWSASRPPGAREAAAASAGGLALIAAGLLAFTARTPFPGAAALLPCAGAALVIRGGSTPNPVSRTLGAAPLARVGRLSYALYLWHWPVLVFAGYGRPTPLPLGERAGLLVLTVLLATLTHVLVERPLIERRLLPRPRPFLFACAAGMFGTVAGGLAINLAGQNRLPLAALPADVLRLANGQYDRETLRCPVGAGADPGCRFGAPDQDPTVALWGNSFARMWVPALAAAAQRHGAAGTVLTLVRCPPLLGVAFPALPDCERFNRDALAYIGTHPGLRTVVLGGDWGAWADDLPGLRRTVDALRARGRRVVLILAPPAVPYAVPRVLALAALRRHAPPPLLTEDAARTARRRGTALLDALAAEGGVATIDPFPAFCDGRTCAVEAGGRPLYYDERHVTRLAAARAEMLFDPMFADPAAP